MIAIGIVESASAGRIRCRKASPAAANWPLMSELNTYIPEMKSRIPRGMPDRSFRPHTVASGITSIPELNRPDGGSASGVPLNTTPKRYARTRPRTNTGMDTPRLANIIVPTSTAELRLTADSIPSGIPMATAMRIANSVSSTVVGRRSMSTVVTGRPRRSESPKSPRKIWPM